VALKESVLSNSSQYPKECIELYGTKKTHATGQSCVTYKLPPDCVWGKDFDRFIQWLQTGTLKPLIRHRSTFTIGQWNTWLAARHFEMESLQNAAIDDLLDWYKEVYLCPVFATAKYVLKEFCEFEVCGGVFCAVSGI
jgi:hypothetical protein